jgi:hypothetical protein
MFPYRMDPPPPIRSRFIQNAAPTLREMVIEPPSGMITVQIDRGYARRRDRGRRDGAAGYADCRTTGVTAAAIARSLPILRSSLALFRGPGYLRRLDDGRSSAEAAGTF